MSFHDVSIETAFIAVGGDAKGLSTAEAKNRLIRLGHNQLKVVKRKSVFRLIAAQFNDFLIWILFGAVIMAMIVGENIDAAVIAIILVLNALFGFIQEYRAENAIAKLKQLTAPKATVMRDGKVMEIPALDLVIGDIVLISEGTKISADLRLIKSANLEIDESSLTGESMPAKKSTGILLKKIAIADMNNMAFTGTIVTQGRAKGIVVATAMATEIGKIAGLISETTRMQTPLKISLAKFGRQLGIGVIGICIVVFLLGSLRGNDPIIMLLAAISLAVAAVPEGLPAVVTITLSLGVQRMAARKALIRHLPAVETLGSTNVICSDKTGTLTHNQMTVTSVYADNMRIEVSGHGYDPAGSFEKNSPGLKKLLLCGALCNDAKITHNNQHYEAIGDPTEAALITSAQKSGIDTHSLKRTNKRLEEIPFSSERKMMSTINKTGKQTYMYTKGSLEPILKRCTKIYLKGKVLKLTSIHKKKIIDQHEKFAKESLRILGFAMKPLTSKKTSEKELIFLGMQAMIDPPREEAIVSIKICKEAGIRVIMITGDHKTTAIAIARTMGIGTRAVTGQELTEIDLEKEIENIDIYARVDPEHKLRIVEAFQKKGYVVAMTGDGVNDAPALKKADIGIAMGISGTDVSKEAAEMILADDNFATIVSAIKEGRTIYDNIRKFVEYLLSCNLGEVLVVLVAILIGLPLPLVAAMILWMNLMTDGLPALALGMNPAEKDIMTLAPRKQKESLINHHMIIRLIFVGGLMCVGTLGVFSYANNGPESLDYARTMAFCTLVFFQLFNVINYSSFTSAFTSKAIHKWLVLAIMSSLLLQLFVVYGLSAFFGTVALSLGDWGLIVGISSIIFILAEVAKLLGVWDTRTKAF